MHPASEYPLPNGIHGTEEARADVRWLDRTTAMHIFDGVLHFARTGSSDRKKLQGDFAASYRLRLGDYRILLQIQKKTLHITGVRQRREAYR
jgi:mRNA-degrading endonuclease RelE of RelBE toxin-antitoxin system